MVPIPMVGMGKELAVREARGLKLHHSVPQVVFMFLDSYSQSVQILLSCKEAALEVQMSVSGVRTSVLQWSS